MSHENNVEDTESRKLRELLAVSYAGVHLYTDDGELQDNREQPAIDFLRDSADEIRAKMQQRAVNDLARNPRT